MKILILVMIFKLNLFIFFIYFIYFYMNKIGLFINNTCNDKNFHINYHNFITLYDNFDNLKVLLRFFFHKLIFFNILERRLKRYFICQR